MGLQKNYIKRKCKRPETILEELSIKSLEIKRGSNPKIRSNKWRIYLENGSHKGKKGPPKKRKQENK